MFDAWDEAPAAYSFQLWFGLAVDALEDEAPAAYSFQLCFGPAVDALEDEALPALPALPFQLGLGVGFGFIADALEDDAWPAISFHAIGVALTAEGPPTSECKPAERLPDQAELLVFAMPKP